MIKRVVDPGRGQRWLTVKNMSGEEIPAFGAMEPYSVDRDGSVLVRKPTADDSNRVLINSGAVIGIGDYGVGTNHMATWAYYDTGDGTPATGESIGTKSGEWKLYRGYEGFLVWGGADEMDLGIVKVQRDVTCRNPSSGLYENLYYPNFGTGYCCGCERFACSGTAATTAFPTSLTCDLTVPCMGTFTQTINIVGSTLTRHCGGQTSGPLGFLQSGVKYEGGTITGSGSSALYTECDTGDPGLKSTLADEAVSVELWCIQTLYGDDVVVCNGAGQWYTKISWLKVSGGNFYNFNACGSFTSISSCSPFYLTDTQSVVCINVGETSKCASIGFPGPAGLTMYSEALSCVGGSAQVEFSE